MKVNKNSWHYKLSKSTASTKCEYVFDVFVSLLFWAMVVAFTVVAVSGVSAFVSSFFIEVDKTWWLYKVGFFASGIVCAVIVSMILATGVIIFIECSKKMLESPVIKKISKSIICSEPVEYE